MGRSNSLILSIMAATLLQVTMAACPAKPSKFLGDILSSANAERALQILRLAAVGAKLSPGNCLSLEDYGPRLLPQQLSRLPLPRQIVNKPVAPVVAPAVIQEKVYPAMPIPQSCAVNTYPEVYPSAPVPMVNPFLPAASPVSAIAPPTSSRLPPVDYTQVRSHFLRKIPIPPPSL